MEIDSLRHLRYVRAAIESGSMRKAAQVLGVQESTVSRRINAIEQHQNIQLFERHSNGVSLTDEGQLWLEAVEEKINSLEEILLKAKFRDKDAEKLHVGLCAPVGLDFLSRLVDQFGVAHPDVEVIFHDGSCAKQFSAIRQRRIDVSFVCHCPNGRSYSNETVWEEGLSVLLPSNHKLARQDVLTWSDLSGEKLLVPSGPDGPQLDSCFLESIVCGPNAPVIEQCHATQTTVMINVRLGKGFTLAGEGLARVTGVDGAVWRPIVGVRSRCQIHAVWLDSNPKRAVFRLLAIAQKLALECFGRRPHRTDFGRANG